MLEVNDFDAIRISLASPEQIKGVVVGRGHQAGDDQLPHAQAGEGRPLLRAHLRSHQGLGVLLRQVQAHPLQGHHLRQVRRRGHALEGAPRAHGPHRAGRAGQPHLVRQGHAEPARPAARHLPAQPGAHPVLRAVHRHARRRGRSASKALERIDEEAEERIERAPGGRRREEGRARGARSPTSAPRSRPPTSAEKTRVTDAADRPAPRS